MNRHLETSKPRIIEPSMEISIQRGQTVKGHNLGKGWKTTGHAGMFQSSYFVEIGRNHDDPLIHVSVSESQIKALGAAQ